MNIGDLFLNLGIKGAEKTVGAIGSARKGMAELGSASIETKAAIVGAFYALERLVQASNSMGTSLTNFTALTGISAQNLQKWQYAARQAGLSASEIEGSLKGVQSAMTNMLLGKGAPEGLGLVSQKVGFDANRARDTLYVMQQLQKFAHSVSPDIGNQVLKSFGLSEGTIAAMRRNAFRPDVFSKAPTYSDKEVGMLDKANIAWSNLSNKIQMAIGHFNALHGLNIVQDISKLTDAVLKFADALMKIIDRFKVFELIGKAFEGWTLIFDKMAKAHPEDFKDTVQQTPGAIMEMLKDFDKINPLNKVFDKFGLGTSSGQNITVNQNLNFQHDGKEADKNADSHKKAINGALRQMTVQGQGS